MLLWILATGCNRDAEALSALDGYWAGSVTVPGGPYPVTAAFTYDKGEDLLTGEVHVGELDATHDYAVRRWEVLKDSTILELTDTLDGTRGLDLDGAVDGDYTADATVRFPCPQGTCGWEGTLAMRKVAGTLGTGGTGAPPPPPGDPTGDTATPGGTAAGGTGAPGGTAAPGGTGAR